MCARPANPELRERILEAAAEIIENCGPDCVTMREVAEKIGYSSTTIYLYFKDKAAILAETVLRAFGELSDSCELAAVGPGPLDMFRQRSRAYIVWGLMNPGRYTLMFESPWDEDWTASWTEENAQLLICARTEDMRLLRQAVSAGLLSPDANLEILEDAVWAGLHGVTSLTISKCLTPEAPGAGPTAVLAIATRTADALVNALLASATPRSA